MSQLSSIVDPVSGKRADDPEWAENRERLRIGNYPLQMGGDPQHFPTYYHCSIHNSGGAAGSLVIEYYLWFPDDHTGEYTLLGIEFGNHRGDWENIAVVISGVFDMSSAELPSTAGVSQVIFNGHITPGKIVRFGDPALHLTDGTHPQVFVAWGTHAMYPEPGEWHNWKGGCAVFERPYDDFFHGNGLVAKSWSPNRELINLGETTHPFVGWLLFNGLWGPDGSASSGSPPSPHLRGEWGTIGEAGDWATIKLAYAAWWEGPIEIDPSIAYPHGIEMEGPSQLAVFEHDLWHGKNALLNVQDHLAIPFISGEVSAAWLLGGARAVLYSGDAFSGQAFPLTHSCPDLRSHLQHGFNDRARSAKVSYGISQAYADHRNFAGYQDGSAMVSGASGPYSTIGRASYHVSLGGSIIANGGNYPEIITLDKRATINASGGSVVIGKFDP
jgi:hypothetical protein